MPPHSQLSVNRTHRYAPLRRQVEAFSLALGVRPIVIKPFASKPLREVLR
jgi:hypothetical protein